MGRSDIDVAVAEDAGLGNRGGRIGMQAAQPFAAHAHGHLYRLGVALGNHADTDHIADGDAFKRDRRSIFQPRGIPKVAAEHELARKQPA